MWTRFMDMHSGGGCKEAPYEHVYIEAPEKEAEIIFYNRFGHNPNRVTCTCCGEDYSVSCSETIEEATEYDRRKSFNDPACVSVEEYEKRGDVLFIRTEEIKDSERIGSLPNQGYVWID